MTNLNVVRTDSFANVMRLGPSGDGGQLPQTAQEAVEAADSAIRSMRRLYSQLLAIVAIGGAATGCTVTYVLCHDKALFPWLAISGLVLLVILAQATNVPTCSLMRRFGEKKVRQHYEDAVKAVRLREAAAATLRSGAFVVEGSDTISLNRTSLLVRNEGSLSLALRLHDPASGQEMGVWPTNAWGAEPELIFLSDEGELGVAYFPGATYDEDWMARSGPAYVRLPKLRRELLESGVPPELLPERSLPLLPAPVEPCASLELAQAA